MTEPALLLKTPEAAKLLNIGKTKAWQMVYAGELPSIKIGHARRIRRSDLDALIERGSEQRPERQAA